jgi:hypothetical protein
MKKVLLILLSFVLIVAYSQDEKKKGKHHRFPYKQTKDSTVYEYRFDTLPGHKKFTRSKKYRMKDTIYMTVKKDSVLGGKCRTYDFSEKKPKK